MANVSLDTLYPQIMPFVGECPDALVDRGIIHAARNLCTTAEVWQETLECDLFDTEADVVLPAGAEIVRPLEVLVDGKSVRAGSLRDVRRGYEQRFALSGEQLIFGKPLAPESEVQLVAALAPKSDAVMLPADLGARWGSTVAAGALAWVLSLPGYDWSNPAAAQQQAAAYAMGVQDAKRFAGRNRAHVPRTVRYGGI